MFFQVQNQLYGLVYKMYLDNLPSFLELLYYQNYIFDLYGTLADIHTDENAPRLWDAMRAYYRKQGAPYRPEELRKAYFDCVYRGL